MDCIAVIPARFASTRFPGKLLAAVAGRPLIEHVVELTGAIAAIDRIVVATDDDRIAEVVRKAGADVVLSNDDFASGTDRVADVAARHPADVIVNVQGDELLIDASAVSDAIETFGASEHELGTLRTPLVERQDLWDPNVVKVVIDDSERALYFSRAPIPFPRAIWQQASAADPAVESWMPQAARLDAAGSDVWTHLGVYLYRPEGLRRWASLPPSRLELIEGLEQLRVLEAGETMQTYLINETVAGVNTPRDLERAEAVVAARATDG